MDKKCGYSACNRGFLPNEEHWNVDGTPCHITQAPGQDDQTVTCYWAYRHERTVARFPWPNTVFRLHWVSLVVLIFTATLHAEPGDVRGCYATYLSQSGKYLFEPFLKVASKTSFSENGEPEIWGFRPWNLEPADEKGITNPVNILEDRFIEMRALKQVGPRKIKCPDNIWN